MDQGLGLWGAPLALIPGMAILAISTTARYTQLLLHIANNPHHGRLRNQLPLLRYSLIALYAGIGMNSLATVSGHLLASNPELSRAVVVVLTCLGATCLVFAAGSLIRDTLHCELRHLEDPGPERESSQGTRDA